VLLGHCHPALVAAGQAALAEGAVLGAPTLWEAEFAEGLQRLIPSLEKVRFVNSGAEAVASALRVARGATGRARILKFAGCYHGHVECLDASGEEADLAGGPLALGASPGAAGETLVAIFNDLASVERIFAQHASELAAVILEPITGSMGVILARREFLAGLQELCRRHGVVLIFDEVLSGLRVARGGAQELLGIRPDLTCLGKALAGGMPVGAFGGRADLMDHLAPLGTVYQAGTFSGNPATVRTGLALLAELDRADVYPQLEESTSRLCAQLRELGLTVGQAGAMFSLGFGPVEQRDHRDAARLDKARFAAFFHACLQRGVYLPPSTGDAACLTLSHTPADLKAAVQVFRQALEGLGPAQPENS
jgi:glutamate-1-semialdehyde 2,1-aminomutase